MPSNPTSSVLFLGSKHLGLRLLQSLFTESPSLKWIVIHPEDADDSRSELKKFQEFCGDKGIELILGQSKSVLRSTIQKYHPSIAVVSGWYSILGKETLNQVHDGFWGIHHSLLPKYRGSAPLVWSILNGDEILGSTIFKFDEGIDTGPILSQVKLKVTNNDNITSIITELETLAIHEFLRLWPRLLSGDFTTKPQNSKIASYSAGRVESDSKVDWTLTSEQVHHHIRAQQYPYPVANSLYDGKCVEILKSTILTTKHFGTPGQIVVKSSEGIIVACGSNSGILISKVKIEGITYEGHDIPSTLRIRFK